MPSIGDLGSVVDIGGLAFSNAGTANWNLGGAGLLRVGSLGFTMGGGGDGGTTGIAPLVYVMRSHTWNTSGSTTLQFQNDVEIFATVTKSGSGIAQILGRTYLGGAVTANQGTLTLGDNLYGGGTLTIAGATVQLNGRTEHVHRKRQHYQWKP